MISRKRILFVIARGDSFGGSSLHVRDMSARLRQDGHQVRVLLGGEPGMEVPRRFDEKGIDYRCLKRLGRKINPLRDAAAMLELRKEIRRFSPDLVSTHASKGGTLGRLACLGLGIPVLYTPHCWSFVDGFPNAWMFRLLEKGLAPITTKIVAVCEDEREFGLAKGIGREDQIIAVHNGVEELTDVAPNRSGTSSSPVRIVMVGRFEAQKDHPSLLRALGQLKDLPWELDLIGEGPLKKPCAELAGKLGIDQRVNFAGYSSDVEKWLSESDLFALITHWEGFPRSVLEAMRAGLPVIVSDVGGSREAVSNEETGFVVARGDQEKLENSLRELISNRARRQAMGRRGREVFRERFTFEKMYRQYRDLYQTLTGEPEPRSFPRRQLKFPAAFAAPLASADKLASPGDSD